MSALKFVSLNIEGDKHLDRILPFLAQEQPDVFCFQELREETVELFKTKIGCEAVYSPMLLLPKTLGKRSGIGIFSRTPILAHGSACYAGVETLNEEFDRSTAQSKEGTSQYIVLWCEIEKEGKRYRIATTHFPWTPDGSASDFQREALKNLLKITAQFDELILCGDFNVPRGGELFSELASIYKDNIPLHYKTSLDLSLHRAASTRIHEIETKMVDGLFTTPGYHVSEVNFVSGVSDHCALAASIL